jgi:isoquinoline 1-oxidoreductase beta subunit
MPYVEMGQGTYTSISMLIAEELEVELRQVQLEHAPPDENLYRNPLLGVQATGNSNAIRGAWQPLRQAGAIARTMLVSAAATRWRVDPSFCRAQSGAVVHAQTGRKIEYGDLAADAARMPVPESVALKQPKDFKLIGTPAKRLDTPAKVNGTAVYGIDARPPGVKIATLAQSPVFGGSVRSIDDSVARTISGVRQIIVLGRMRMTSETIMVLRCPSLMPLPLSLDRIRLPKTRVLDREVKTIGEPEVWRPGSTSMTMSASRLEGSARYIASPYALDWEGF